MASKRGNNEWPSRYRPPGVIRMYKKARERIDRGGVFVQRWCSLFAGLRRHRIRWLLVGSLCLSVAICASLLPGSLLTESSEPFLTVCQAALTGTGIFLLFSTIVFWITASNPPKPRIFKQRSLTTPVSVPVIMFSLAAACAVLSFFLYGFFNHIILDDYVFEKAVERANVSRSPAALRDYKANKKYQRHRDECKQRIAVYYDKAIAELKERAKQHPADISPVFFNGLVAVLEGLKEADSPWVTVDFKSQNNPLPTTPEQKNMEKLVYDLRLAANEELK